MESGVAYRPRANKGFENVQAVCYCCICLGTQWDHFHNFTSYKTFMSLGSNMLWPKLFKKSLWSFSRPWICCWVYNCVIISCYYSVWMENGWNVASPFSISPLCVPHIQRVVIKLEPLTLFHLHRSLSTLLIISCSIWVTDCCQVESPELLLITGARSCFEKGHIL